VFFLAAADALEYSGGNMFRDRKYFSTLLKIALPITGQYLILNSLGVADVIMIGQMGEVSVAAVGLANEVFFILGLFMFGIGSGAAIFTAQYWGKGDTHKLHQVIGLSLCVALGGAVIFGVISLLFSGQVLHIYTQDAQVVALGSQYLRIIAACFIPYAITASFSAVLRSTGNVKLPMLVSGFALSLNTFMNYLLILGNFGFPALGVKGAAIATLISRFVECTLMVALAYALKTPVAARINEFFSFDFSFVKRFFRTSAPVVVNEALWSLGITTYDAVFARIGTEAIAAVNISRTIENLAFVAFMGLGNACAIVVGNKIGAGEEHLASTYGKRTWILGMLVAVLLGIGISLSAGRISMLYKISDTTRVYARNVIFLLGTVMWLKGSNMIIFIGMLRSGGDTRYALIVEMITMWGVGVPLAFFSAFVLHLPVYWVYLIILMDELTKFSIGLVRVFSGKWIHNLVKGPQIPIPGEVLAAE
jgi:putative MATE family efflux protein